MSESQKTNVLPVALGIAITIVLLGFLFVTSQRIRQDPRLVPSLSILAPAPNTVLDSPLVIRFATTHPIRLGPTGWGFHRLHLHAWVGGVQHMPAAADIIMAPDSTYLWTLWAAGRGPARIHLGWADTGHRELRSGASDTVQVTIR